MRNLEAYSVIVYTSTYKKLWNEFVANAKNATFLFHRDFMEYHKDRFEDFSLLVFKETMLIAVVPANKSGAMVYTHQGLSYGGVVLSKKVKFNETISIYKAILAFLETQHIERFELKLTPRTYHKVPADEVDYILFLLKAKLTRRDLASVIQQDNFKLPIQSNRKDGVRKGKKNLLEVREEKEFASFWETILIPNLQKRHQATPVHSVKEITQLANLFPQHIKQFNVYKEEELVAGTTLFITDQVVHVQYISSNDDRQILGSLDFLFSELIQNRFKDKRYFDFGISNEAQGTKVNIGLHYWKECFGARGIVHDFYSINPKKHTLLDAVLI